MDCEGCGKRLDDNGFVEHCSLIGCMRLRRNFERRVQEVKADLRLPVLAKMEVNELPADFTPSRQDVVALAGLLMTALRQNQEMAQTLKAMKIDMGKPSH